MNPEKSINKKKIMEVFHAMDMGNEFVDLKHTHESIRKRFVQSIDNGISIFSQVTKERLSILNPLENVSFQEPKIQEHSTIHQNKIINGIIRKLRENCKDIINPEVIIRGFLYKEAEKSVTEFINYLENYSWPMSSIACQQIVFFDDTPLSFIGNFLGQIFSQRRNEQILIQASAKMYVILRYIFDIIYSEWYVKIITQAVHVMEELDFSMAYGLNLTLQLVADLNNAIVNTPVIIFSDSDLNSACNVLLDAAFAYQGQMPWSVNTVYVQEDVMHQFVDKLKFQLQHLTWGSPDNKQVDFSYPYLINEYEEKYASLIKDAESKGLEIFQSPPAGPSTKFQPTLILGGKLYNQGILKPRRPTIPYLNISAFRTVKEGIALLNNENQTFAAGVWSENIGLVTTIIHEINADTIWVNSHGVFNPEEPRSFNGISTNRKINAIKLDPSIVEDLAKCRKAQSLWSQKSFSERLRILRQMNTDDILTSKMMVQYSPSVSTIRICGSYEFKQISRSPSIVLFKTVNFELFLTSIIPMLLEGNGVIIQFKEGELDTSFSKFFHLLNECINDIVILIPTDKNYDFSSVEMIYEYSPSYFHRNYYKNIWTSLN